MPPGTARTFRIFISSTFSDLVEERNALHRVVFPALRSLCNGHGCRLQPIDLRWGVRGEASLDQQTMRICLDEIVRSQRVSPRPNFVVLLGERYGWQPLPSVIPSSDFERLSAAIQWPEDRELLTRWYRRDDNAVPPEHRLLPRSGALAGYDEWVPLERRLLGILRQAAQTVFLEPAGRTPYETSATEQEILAGALNVPGASDHVFCYFRKIKGLPRDKRAGEFVDLDEHGVPDLDARGKLDALKDRLRRLLPGHVAELETSWTENGVADEHIAELCRRVYADLASVILEEISRLEAVDPVTRESLDHESFARARARHFVGRGATLDRMSDYLRGGDARPLILAGVSGSGKTALMCRAAEEARRLCPEAVVIIRCIGATPASIDARDLLEGLCRQISDSYEGIGRSVPSEYKALVEDLPRRLGLATRDRPIILFLDAVDQLSPAHHARALGWLPAALPPFVRLVTSTTLGEGFEAVSRVAPDSPFLQLESMLSVEGSTLLAAWLDDVGRTLQPSQSDEIARKFNQYGLPLYLRVVFEEARRWTSDASVPDLAPDIPSAIRDLYTRLSADARHGPVLVASSLGLLSAAKNGLSEDELLDVLSADPEVLTDFELRARHSPPEKRLPVVVWSRLYFDLETSFTERNADGASLLCFYHRQFEEVATEMFLGGPDGDRRHASLAGYFAGQPLLQRVEKKDAPNLRKLSELPYQQTLGGLRDDLVATLTDPTFLEAKCAYSGSQAAGDAIGLPVRTGVYELLEDYRRAEDTIEDLDESLALIGDALRLSAHHLQREPGLLGSQLVGRLTGIPRAEIQAFLRRIVPRPGHDLLRALTPGLIAPGSNLEAILGRSASDISSFWMSDRGDTAASLSDREPSLMVWDLVAGSLRYALKAGEFEITSAAVTPDCRTAVVNTGQEVLVWDLVNGKPASRVTVSDYCKLAITPDGSRVVICSDGLLLAWDQGKDVEPRTCGKPNVYPDGISVSSDGRLAFVTNRSFNKVGPFWRRRHQDTYTTEVWDLDAGKGVSLSGTTPLSIGREGRLWAVGISRRLEIGAPDGGRTSAHLDHRGPIHTIHMTPSGATVLTLSGKGRASVWDVEGGRKPYRLPAGSRAVCAALRPDGGMAAVASDDGTIVLSDLRTRRATQRLKGHGSEITSMQFMLGGGRLVCGDEDEVVTVFDTSSGAEVCRLRGSDPVPTPDGLRIVTIVGRRTILLWRPQACAAPARSEEHGREVNQVVCDPGGSFFASASGDRSIKVWDTRTYEEAQRWEGHRDSVRAILITPDSRFLASASWDNTVRCWDMLQQRPGRAFDGGGPLLLSPHGSQVIFLGPDGVEERDLETGERGRSIRMERSGVECLAVSPDGNVLIAGDLDGNLRVHDLDRGVPVHTLRGHTASIRGILVTPDGSGLVSVSSDRTLRLWDLTSGRNTFTRVAPSPLEKAALVPGTPLVVVGDYRGAVSVWDLERKRCLRTMPGHRGTVTDIVIIDSRAISTARDGGIRVWDFNSGKCVAAYYADTAVSGCAVDPSGKILAAGDELGRIHFLRLEHA